MFIVVAGITVDVLERLAEALATLTTDIGSRLNTSVMAAFHIKQLEGDNEEFSKL